ncbi:unnamed protein product [Acanthoscelides obtectus]|uniref:Uncharacterized protein n=1 Tax=Acanthoscelides obtectus TaxID=200917 RepID=A0A9P0JIJ4_ACAOB|nr:unnamed protein product [Acanthoscelides obtectus]CAK1661561.1 hypothetical protein AOBTE_LOCUS22685 [Acanthoscelides obtectus]
MNSYSYNHKCNVITLVVHTIDAATERLYMYTELKNSPTEDKKTNYNNYRNKLGVLIDAAKRSYYQNELEITDLIQLSCGGP